MRALALSMATLATCVIAQPAMATVSIIGINVYRGSSTGNCLDTINTANCSPLGVTQSGSASNPFLNNLATKEINLGTGSYYLFGNPYAPTNYMIEGQPISIMLTIRDTDMLSGYAFLKLATTIVPDLTTPGTVLFSFNDHGIKISTTGITNADRMGFGLNGAGFQGDGSKDFVLRLDYGVTSPVPEPASWAMMIGGFGFVGGAMRRQMTRARFA
jgi:hypothetical protein